MSRKVPPGRARAPEVTLCVDVLRKIRRHARASPTTEVCGVLIGTTSDDGVVVEECIQGVNAAQGSAHVTFTQEAWEHIYRIKDRDYPHLRIVGWYHSHPGFGVFLSDQDVFIQKNFFSAPTQIAWVYDPHSDAEGCFGYVDGEIKRLRDMRVRDDGMRVSTDESEFEDPGDAVRRLAIDEPPVHRRKDLLFTVLSYVAAVLLGAALALYFLGPMTVVVRVPKEQHEERMRSRPADSEKHAPARKPVPEQRTEGTRPGGDRK